MPATRGRFSTAPELGTPSGFSFGLASCANDGLFAGTSSTAAYEAVRRTPNLLFFFHLGDLHYANLRTDEVARRLKAYDEKIGQVGIAELFRAMPVPYTWDDHDFLGDDSRGADPAISANTPKARLAYDLYVPHYGLPADAGIYQSFQIGRVLFIATDSRAFQRPATGRVNGTMLGEKQLEWFKGELVRGKALDLIVWANSAPWVIESSNPPDDDDWGAYAAERAVIGQFIKDNDIRNLCMISGDAHMLAIDDGHNTGFAAGKKGGFPLFHVAALQSDGSKKGGPYSHGTFKGNKQYGTCEIRYNAAGQAHVVWKGFNAGSSTTNPKIAYDFDAATTFVEF